MQPKDYTEELDLQKYWLVLKRRWLPATGIFGLVMTLSAVAAVLQKPSYTATASLLVEADRSSSLVGLTDVETGELRSLATNNSPVETQAEILRSDAIVKATATALNQARQLDEPLTPKAISEGLKVKNVPSTDVLEISFTHDDPEMAARVVNRIVEAYIRSNIDANRAETAAAREFISRQLPSVEASVRAAELALRQFKEANQIVALDSEAEAAVNLIASLDQKIADSQSELAKIATRSQALRNQLGMDAQQAAIMASLSQTPGVQEVLQQYQAVQSQLAIEQARYRSSHPTVAGLQRQADSLRTLLQQRVEQVLGSQGLNVPEGGLQLGRLREDLTADLIDAEIERASLTTQTAALRQMLSGYRDRASVLPRLAQTQSELQRKLAAAQSTYETLLTRLQEVQVAENQNVGNARIISDASLPEQPMGPSSKLFIIAGGMAGLLLAVATAFLIDLCDRSVKTVQEARQLFGYTLLGLIPTHHKPHSRKLADPSAVRIFPRDLPRSAISEAYHMLQANLKFLSSDKELRVIVVTSSVAGEGKSTIAANLAASAAQVGRRVLLVDADMRYPQQHHIWDLINTGGLSNVIVGQQELNNAIQPAMPGLDVLPAGIVPPNPVALLDSKRMASLMETFADSYDLVILDTPPLVGVADAAILGKMSDGILMVVRPGVVDSVGATAAKEYLLQSHQPILGLVANGITMEKERDGYFYHHREQIGSETGSFPKSLPFRVMQRESEPDRLQK
ncbi:MAG: polysaccharide biosynthesis tyrosine autokinase [Elainella sp. Prado103]|nr:polysaccharide biosynthesis tyrosine autokinase [Elainella sp. Prado103]